MKKTQIILSILLFTSIACTSCNEYKSFSSATKVSQLSGNPFYYQLSKSVLKNIGSFLVEKELKSTVGKLNLTTPLSSILTTTDNTAAFKSMLGNSYKISSRKLNSANFDQLGNIKNLISFVAKNGSHFNFYTSK